MDEMLFMIYGVSDCPHCLWACGDLMEANLSYVFVNLDFAQGYHESFKPVMDWTYKRLAEGVRSFAEMFADGGPDVNIAPGSMQYALVGPSREQAVQRMQIKVPYATSESTGLSTTERPNGPWLMWAGTAAAHIMFEKRPPGVPFDYPGQ